MSTRTVIDVATGESRQEEYTLTGQERAAQAKARADRAARERAKAAKDAERAEKLKDVPGNANSAAALRQRLQDVIEVLRDELGIEV